MDDVLCDFLGRAQVGVHEHVGLFVKRLARGEERADFFERIFILQQRPVRLVFHALPDFFWRRPKAYDERVGFQAVEIFLVRRKSAARRDHDVFGCGKFVDDFAFEFTECFFTVVSKDL